MKKDWIHQQNKFEKAICSSFVGRITKQFFLNNSYQSHNSLLGITMDKDQKRTSHHWGEKRSATFTQPGTVCNQKYIETNPKNHNDTIGKLHLDVKTEIRSSTHTYD